MVDLTPADDTALSSMNALSALPEPAVHSSHPAPPVNSPNPAKDSPTTHPASAPIAIDDSDSDSSRATSPDPAPEPESNLAASNLPPPSAIFAAIPPEGIRPTALLAHFGGTMADMALRNHIRPFVVPNNINQKLYLAPKYRAEAERVLEARREGRELSPKGASSIGNWAKGKGKAGQVRGLTRPRRERLSLLLHIMNAVSAVLKHEFGNVRPEAWDKMKENLPGMRVIFVFRSLI